MQVSTPLDLTSWEQEGDCTLFLIADQHLIVHPFDHINGLAQFIITILTALLASGGFWAFLQNRMVSHDEKLKKQTEDTENNKDILKGLVHAKIVATGMEYIQRGWITKDEYRDFFEYLYDPYAAIGGNGLAKKIANEVRSLPISNGDSVRNIERQYRKDFNASHQYKE